MLKGLKPITAGQRFTRLVVDKHIWKGKPEKTLVQRNHISAGRDNFGHISVRHRSAPMNKRLYRIVDFKRNAFDASAEVVRIEYDPNRTAYIALIKYENDQLSYIIAPEGLKAGDIVSTHSGAVPVKNGHCGRLKNIPVGSTIHCIEMLADQGAKIARSAGSYGKLLGINDGKAILMLKSGEMRMVSEQCKAVIGVVSKGEHVNRSLGKAGRNRWMGIRPSVRGTAMNPIDHPHGGGEGKSRGRHPVTPSGKPTKGLITRKNKRGEKMIITSARIARHRKKR